MKGRYKGKHAWALGILSLLFLGSLAHSPVGSSRKPQTLWLGYLSAPRGVGLSPYRKVFFICSSVCVQAYRVHPELLHFSCLWVGWVTCHPVSIRPNTWKARTTVLWEQGSACGINHDLGEPTKFTQCTPEGVTYIWNICMYMHTYIHVCLHTCIYAWIHIHTCIHKESNVCLLIYIPKYIHSYMYVCNMCVYVHKYTHIFPCISAYVHVYMHTCNESACTYIYVCLHTYIYA